LLKTACREVLKRLSYLTAVSQVKAAHQTSGLLDCKTSKFGAGSWTKFTNSFLQEKYIDNIFVAVGGQVF
jgi:hypothetical protein